MPNSLISYLRATLSCIFHVFQPRNNFHVNTATQTDAYFKGFDSTYVSYKTNLPYDGHFINFSSEIATHFKNYQPSFITHIYDRLGYNAHTKFHAFTNQIWAFDLDTESFEVFHGLSSIAKLIPDKLKTAISVNQEFCRDPTEDGSFLTSLITDLLSFYQKLLLDRRNKVFPLTVEILHSTFSDPPHFSINASNKHMKELSMEDVIIQFSELLSHFKLLLLIREPALLETNAALIKTYASAIVTYFYYYERTVRPLLLKLTRSRKYSKHEPKSSCNST